MDTPQNLRNTVENLERIGIFVEGDKDAVLDNLRDMAEDLSNCRIAQGIGRYAVLIGDITSAYHDTVIAKSGMGNIYNTDRSYRYAQQQAQFIRDASAQMTELVAETDAYIEDLLTNYCRCDSDNGSKYQLPPGTIIEEIQED